MKHPTSRNMGFLNETVRRDIAALLVAARRTVTGDATVYDRRLATIRRAGVAAADVVSSHECKRNLARSEVKREQFDLLATYWRQVGIYFQRADDGFYANAR